MCSVANLSYPSFSKPKALSLLLGLVVEIGPKLPSSIGKILRPIGHGMGRKSLPNVLTKQSIQYKFDDYSASD